MDTPSRLPAEVDPRIEAWLEVATSGLAEEARLRVREEIVDHVTESVAERLAAGASADEALVAAVGALGDAARAGRALRRANLRPSEAKIIGSLARPQPRWILALYLAGAPVFIVANARFLEAPRTQILFLVGYLGIVAGIAARFWLARLLARKGRLRAALVADVFGPWLFYASLVVGSNLLYPKGHQGWSIVIYVGAFVLAAVFVARLWPKIGRFRPRPS